MNSKLNKQILALAIPNILTNLSVPLLSSVDTAVVGHLDEAYYLGAIAIGSMIFNFIYWAFGFLRMGTTGLTSQAVGKGDNNEVALNLFRPALIAIAFGIILISLQFIIAEFSFSIISASPEVEQFAREYFYIRIFAAPATLLIYVFHGWFLGMQNAKYPLILLVTVNILNLVFNIVFIFQFGMKSEGVAYGTVLAQYSGLLIAIILFIKKYNSQLKYFSINSILEFSKLKQFYQVNSNIFIRTLALLFVLSFFTAESAKYGDNILAANTILMQMWIIISYAVDGFAFAAESLVGKLIGANDKARLKQTIKYLFVWGTGIGLVFTIIYSFTGELIINVFTSNKVIINIALSFVGWTIISQMINSISFIWDGIYIGATKTKAMRNSMLLSAFAVFLPAYFLTKDVLGNHSLWFALTLFMIVRAVTLTIVAKKNIL
ncbi:MAG: MATE family efflux transporter [Melioribacteraceae bacterium]|jgi:MATE family multidrug resistance protein|nr:MATE family efflux transporter [Melioribacteraceae bacterium]